MKTGSPIKKFVCISQVLLMQLTYIWSKIRLRKVWRRKVVNQFFSPRKNVPLKADLSLSNKPFWPDFSETTIKNNKKCSLLTSHYFHWY